MTHDKILENLERLPTLVDKLRFIETSLPTDEKTLKQIAHEVRIEAYKQEMPLFADLAEEEVLEVTGLSGAEVYGCLAVQVLRISYYCDAVIESYKSNPIVAEALSGKSISNRFNRDRKIWRWNKNEVHYRELIGDQKPKEGLIAFLNNQINQYNQRQASRKFREKYSSNTYA